MNSNIDRDASHSMISILVKLISNSNSHTFRQKLRKYIKADFEDDVAKFRENPDEDDVEEAVVPEEDDEDDGDDSDGFQTVGKSSSGKSDLFKKG